MTTGERTRVPRGEAKARIVAAATRLFARQGYESTSTRQIVEAAEVTKGAMYHWFGSKEELLTSIYHELLAEQTERLAAIADGDAPVADRLRDAVLDLFDHMAEHAEALTVWARSMHLVGGVHAESVRRDRRRYHEIFRDLVREGQVAGVLRDDLLPSVVANTCLSSITQIHTWFHEDGPISRKELGRQMAVLFLMGMVAPGAGGPTFPRIG